jgi:hypothetical protein
VRGNKFLNKLGQPVNNEVGAVIVVLIVLVVLFLVVMGIMCAVCAGTGNVGCEMDFARVCRDYDSEDDVIYCSPAGHGQIGDVATAKLCCDPNNLEDALSPLPDACPLKERGKRELISLLEKILQEEGLSIEEIEKANQLLSALLATFSDGGLSSGATGGGTLADKPKAAGDLEVQAPPKAKSKVTAGGGTPTGDLGSIGGSTAPTAPTQTQVAAASAVAGAVYKSGGKGPASPAKKGFGINLSDGIEAPKSGEMKFGAEASAVNPVASEDPEDYFTRVGLDENLFKILHKRYQSIHAGWTRIPSAK